MTGTFQEPRYQIDSPDFLCAECRGEVACEASYFSAIFFQEETFLRKNYCLACWQAKVAPDPQGARAFAFWRARRPTVSAERPKRARFDPALAFEFFRRLGEDLAERPGLPLSVAGHPTTSAPGGRVPAPVEAAAPSVEEKEEIRFVLALLLVRKKVLAFLSSRDEGGVEWLKLEARAPAPPKPGEGGEGEEPPAAGSAPVTAQPGPEDRIHWVKNPNLADAQLDRVKDRVCDLLQIQM